MPFKTTLSLTPAHQLKSNKKGKKKTIGLPSRGVFEKDVGEDLSDTFLAAFKMLDEDRIFEDIEEIQLDKMIEQFRPMNDDLLYKKQSQEIRCKPSKVTNKRDPQYVDKAILELGQELNKNFKK